MIASNDNGAHEQVWLEIPWYVNGRLSSPARERVEVHAAECEACAIEIAAQRELLAAMASTSDVAILPELSFDKLAERLDAPPEVKPASAAAPSSAGVRLALRWTSAAVAIEAFALVLVSVLLWRQSTERTPPSAAEPAAVYRTVTDSAPSTPEASVRIVFTNDMTVGQLQALLHDERLQIVAGPSEAGAYTLAASPDMDASARHGLLDRLRSHPGVRFAESIARAQP